MRYRKLGRSGLNVSEICLGTMTWGSQNDANEAHAQIDMALDAGVNFIDTAEMYPTTPRQPETTGRTEEILGGWIAASNGKRGDVIIATKITGEGNQDIRGGVRIDGENFTEVFESSLSRLQTDYIDLYQLHWPNRGSYHFRRNWNYDPYDSDVGDMAQEVCDILGAAGRLIAAGKLRAVGLSNETAWGTLQFLNASVQHDLPRIVSVQNEYSMLCRLYDTDMAELSAREEIGLLAYSPLAAGLLTGKYLEDSIPPGSRRTIQSTLFNRVTSQSLAATEEYAEIARKHSLKLSQMSLAFCLSRPFMGSVIIGATNREQLAENLGAAELSLDDDVLEDIASVRRQYPMPF